MGTKKWNPVSVPNNIVVLSGVRVTHEFIAAIQLIIAKGRFIPGII